jgi:acetolactate synthase-1/2/3 large subunit
MLRCGEALVRLLAVQGIDTAFGIPGVHTVEFYRGFGNSGLRHITPRHEQGAAFMAYGYAMATGRPAACFLITGPGVLNAATGIAEAYANSVPMLVLASVNRSDTLGMGGGQLHELPSQQQAMSQVTAFTHTLLDPRNLPEVLARAFAVFNSGRPRPVCIEIPTDVLAAEADIPLDAWPATTRAAPDPATLARIVAELGAARAPAMLLGGGAAETSDAATRLAERLDAPVIETSAGKGVVSEEHPLCLGDVPPFEPGYDLLAEADVVLAVGTEMADTDRYAGGRYDLGGKLVRIDIDAGQLIRNHRPQVGLLSDARLALDAILDGLAGVPAPEGRKSGAERAQAVRDALEASDAKLTREAARHRKVLDVVRSVLPDDGIVCADSTQLAYTGFHHYRARRPRTWHFPNGFCALGFGLPVAMGAKIGAPERAAVCLAGDGGFHFTMEELSAAVEQKLPVAVIVWRNGGYEEIRDSMAAEDIQPTAVDLHLPDFAELARSFGCHGARADSLAHLEDLLRTALAGDRPTLIEIDATAPFLDG